MEQECPKFYITPDNLLQQGDIFRIEIVCPGADTIKRIFRTIDGRHGSAFFASPGQKAKIFDQDDLENLLSTASRRTELHVDPFCKTPDGQDEMVVVAGRLFHYFIIATQTCDVSGKDKKPYPYATILPVIPFAIMCKNEILPIPNIGNMTIHKFIVDYAVKGEELDKQSDADYGAAIRIIIEDSLKLKVDKKFEKNLKLIRSFLNDYHTKGYMYPLHDDVKLSVPESYIDFSSTFAVPTDKLIAINSMRIARIATPYREDFALKFATFFSRVALTVPMKPEKLS